MFHSVFERPQFSADLPPFIGILPRGEDIVGWGARPADPGSREECPLLRRDGGGGHDWHANLFSARRPDHDVIAWKAGS